MTGDLSSQVNSARALWLASKIVSDTQLPHRAARRGRVTDARWTDAEAVAHYGVFGFAARSDQSIGEAGTPSATLA
jgi:hypothetical protein